MSDLELLGRAAYDAYCQCTGGRSLISGELLPTWNEQRPDIREAWRAAADAVVMLQSLSSPITDQIRMAQWTSDPEVEQ